MMRKLLRAVHSNNRATVSLNRVRHMMGQLRRLNPKVINALQIKSNVISCWLKHNNLRRMQYMVGEKYVNSTRRYQVSNLNELQHQLQQVIP